MFFSAFFIAGLVLGVFLPVDVPVNDSPDGYEVSQNVLETFSKNNPDSELEVLNVERESGLYKIRLSTGQDEGTFQTVYATKDGELVTTEVINLDEMREMIDKRIDFLDCLRENNVRFYGAVESEEELTSRASLLQIQVLGGLDHLDDLYFDCSNRMEECAEQGLEDLPATVYDDGVFYGITQYEWLEENVGCTF